MSRSQMTADERDEPLTLPVENRTLSHPSTPTVYNSNTVLSLICCPIRSPSRTSRIGVQRSKQLVV